MHVLLALLSALILSPSLSLAAPAVPVCPGGRFFVTPEPGAPSLIGVSTELEVIQVQGLETPPGVVAISSGCGRIILNIKVTKRGAVVKAVWPPGGCRGESVVRLKGTIDAGCLLSGLIKKKKQKPRKFTAALSRCGDGVVDAATEGCEPQLGCSDGRACEAACRCARATTTTIVSGTSTSTLPSTASTVTTSTSTSSTGGQATSTVTTSTTTTTAPPGGSCTDASAPMCSAECGSGITCTDSLCADPDQLCFADEECDAGFCVLLGEFGVCAVDESCGAGDESCDSGLCVSYPECFCWFP